MPEMENLQLFDDQAIRTAWNKEEEEWYFSVVDVVGVLTDQPDVRRAAKYWSVLKTRLKQGAVLLYIKMNRCPDKKFLLRIQSVAKIYLVNTKRKR